MSASTPGTAPNKRSRRAATVVVRCDGDRFPSDALAACVTTIRAGGVVVIPTDTVYGLACNAFDPTAVARIYKIKGRDYRKPLPILLPSARELPLVAAEILPEAETLMRSFWPGALTLVVKTAAHALNAARGKDTVAVRVPAHGAIRKLLDAFALPIAATSANRSGRNAITTGTAAQRHFSGHADLIVDGGPCAVGRESTVVDVTRFPFTVIREGAVSKLDLLRVLKLISS